MFIEIIMSSQDRLPNGIMEGIGSIERLANNYKIRNLDTQMTMKL